MITWFNYSLGNKLFCEHLFKEPKLAPAMEFAAELELCFLPLVVLRKQMEMVLKTYTNLPLTKRNEKVRRRALGRQAETHTHTHTHCTDDP